MKKTGSQVEKDIFHLVKNSAIATAITGKVYRDGMRPHNSKLEDAVVIFITALDGQNQIGSVSINVYVSDLSYGGYFLKDLKRCSEIEAICQTFINSLPTNDYLFSLGQLINTFEEKEINQHFINIKLNYKYNSLN
jgi:hypothetical protein